MPPDRDYLTQRMPIRGKIAVALLHESPFWRDTDRTIFIDDNLTVWDEGGGELPTALSGLVSIPCSRQLAKLDPQTRKETILSFVATHLGPRAEKTCGYHEINWAAEPWSRGCNSFMTTGVWSTWGYTLRESVGRVHWAGAEMSDRFVGQMEGAVRSAQVTAQRLLACT
jgi:monoamine oxidase